MSVVTIPFRHNLEVTIEKFVDACDESQLNELCLLTNKKLDSIERDSIFQDAKVVEQIQFSPF